MNGTSSVLQVTYKFYENKNNIRLIGKVWYKICKNNGWWNFFLSSNRYDKNIPVHYYERIWFWQRKEGVVGQEGRVNNEIVVNATCMVVGSVGQKYTETAHSVWWIRQGVGGEEVDFILR